MDEAWTDDERKALEETTKTLLMNVPPDKGIVVHRKVLEEFIAKAFRAGLNAKGRESA